MSTGYYYFSIAELAKIGILALCSVMLNIYLPSKTIAHQYLRISGPGAGGALFGGIIFVFWVSFALKILKKKYSAITITLVIASLSMLLSPWYGIVSPVWFSIYGFASLVSMGLIIELMGSRSLRLDIIGGGLGNLVCIIITWIGLWIHTNTQIVAKSVALLILIAFISGCIGVLMTYIIINMVHHKNNYLLC